MSEANPNHLQQRMEDIEQNPHLITFYSNTKCKDCHGRGYRTVSVPNQIGQWVEHRTICHCVKKAVRKEAKALEQSDG